MEWLEHLIVQEILSNADDVWDEIVRKSLLDSTMRLSTRLQLEVLHRIPDIPPGFYRDILVECLYQADWDTIAQQVIDHSQQSP